MYHRPKFTFHERDDNLAFCPILHVFALAFADQAFESEYLQRPQDLHSFRVNDDRGLLGIPLEWKSSMLEMPVFRKATDSTEGWTYDEARAHVSRLGRAAGFKDPLQFYQGRRGAGEAIDGK